MKLVNDRRWKKKIMKTLVSSILPKNNATVWGKLFDEQPINFDHYHCIQCNIYFIRIDRVFGKLLFKKLYN